MSSARSPLRALLLVVTALAVACTLLAGPATTSADAASKRTWGRLANCESGGNWRINTGNGYYGGLQFSASTWRAYGGRHFAPRADKTRRVAQIAVAHRVLRNQGWGAWPACSSKLGLGAAEKRQRWGRGRWNHGHGHHFNAGGHKPGIARAIEYAAAVEAAEARPGGPAAV